jgi:thioredoxin-dependent peroxiredoxin
MSLSKGDKAPSFTGKDQDGKPIKLSDYKGQKVVLYFYPNDDTPGCTAESCNLRDNYSKLKKANYAIIGVSANDEKSHQKFIKKYSLPFPLIADTDKKINEMYGVWKEKSTFGKIYMGTVRTTFVINEKGVIEDIIEKVKTEDHTAQILK